MKTAFFAAILLFLASTHATAEKPVESTTYINETELLKDFSLRKTNVFKRATLVHAGVRYHVYSGGVGSTMRVFRAYIFRETNSRFAPVFHTEYRPWESGSSALVLVPEFEGTSINIVAVGKKTRRVARFSLTQ